MRPELVVREPAQRSPPETGRVRNVVSLPDVPGDMEVHFADVSAGFPPFPLWDRLWAVFGDEIRLHDLRDEVDVAAVAGGGGAVADLAARARPHDRAGRLPLRRDMMPAVSRCLRTCVLVGGVSAGACEPVAPSADDVWVAFQLSTATFDGATGLIPTGIFGLIEESDVPLRLTPDSLDRHPSWSPDGLRLAYSGTRSGNEDIYVVRAGGREPVRLTADPGTDVDPAWSPDGQWIAFISDREGQPAVYIVAADGSDPVRITPGAHWERDPAWNPGSDRLVFSRIHSANVLAWREEIHSILLDGTGEARLTEEMETGTEPVPTNRSPAWSPDGSTIAWTRIHYTARVFRMAVDGSDRNVVTESGGYPAWSPDGAALIYAWGGELWRVNADGRAELIADLGHVHIEAPAWRPEAP